MANLGKKGDVFVARFRYDGKEYKKSLHTKDQPAAEAALHEVEGVLYRLDRGWLAVPPNVDPGDFIVSGGTLQTPSQQVRSVAPTVRDATEQFLANLGHLAASNRSTIATHLRNLHRCMGEKADRRIDRVTYADLESFRGGCVKDRKPQYGRNGRR